MAKGEQEDKKKRERPQERACGQNKCFFSQLQLQICGSPHLLCWQGTDLEIWIINMALLVKEFQDQGYKIRKIFA
jgi:hypothetical protein